MTDFYKLARPALMGLSPETAHSASILAMRLGAANLFRAPSPDPALQSTAFGLSFDSPVGLAAGYDKDAMIPKQMMGLGFGFCEVGTLTPLPQPGNPRPRIFRLKEDRAVINRLGFNNGGQAAAKPRLEMLRKAPLPGILGINVGANKNAADRTLDYVTGIQNLGALADYLVINISSPNTPGLRALQSREALDDLLARCLDARASLPNNPPLLLKLAPDLEDQDISDICDVLQTRAVDGLIISNTTITRPNSLKSPHAGEVGGLSGAPLMELSTSILKRFYRALGGRVRLVGAGGIASGQDAYTKIRAGASLVQIYSALVYEGPGLVAKINRELATMVKADGFSSISQAIGLDA